jgi:hypothetical protein
MEEQGVIDLVDLRVISYKANHENCINSIQDFVKLESRISRQLTYYNLRSFLILVHDKLIGCPEAEKLFPFSAVSGMLSKYILLNSDIASGWSPIFIDEFLYFLNMVISCSSYDPEFMQKSQPNNKDIASLFLKMIGIQTRWNIPCHNLWGRTLYMYEELASKSNTPDLIREIVTSKFEERFGLSLHDFIRLGFIINCLSQQPGYISRDYFDLLRRKKIPIPDNNNILTFLKLISLNPLAFRKICANSMDNENHLNIYEFNQLFNYPLIRLHYGDDNKEAKYDEFIAPVPRLLTHRFTTGLYYQLFNSFGKNSFSDSFGALFENYIEDLFHWYNLSGKVISGKQIPKNLRCYKKGHQIKIPDLIIFCREGTILIECKATKYSQDLYENGLDASEISKGCIRQLNKGINQLRSFEQYIPEIMQSYGITNKSLPIQKIIVTFEPLLALNVGPLRKWMNIGNDDNRDCMIVWAWYLEEIQPYIAKGASFWKFLIDFPKIEFNDIIKNCNLKQVLVILIQSCPNMKISFMTIC